MGHGALGIGGEQGYAEKLLSYPCLMPHPSVLFNFSLALQQNAKVENDWCKTSAYWLSYIKNPENSKVVSLRDKRWLDQLNVNQHSFSRNQFSYTTRTTLAWVFGKLGLVLLKLSRQLKRIPLKR